MEVYLDAQNLDEFTIRGENLEEILSEIMDTHLPVDRTISEVKIDGQRYSEKTPRAAVGLARKQINRLDVLTIPTTSLAQAMLNTGPSHLVVLHEAALKVADEFRLGDEAEANEQYLAFLQALQDFFAFLSQTLEVLAVPLAHLETKDLSAKAKLRDLTNILSEMSEHQEDRDWVLLADLLEYELAPMLSDWRTILSEVRTAAH